MTVQSMTSEELQQRETVSLIAADKVHGTAVYGMDGEKIGSVERLMIDKRSGKVSFVVLSVGGFLGIGDSRHPLPWNELTYDDELSGYVVGVPADTFRDAPSYDAQSEPDWGSPAYGRGIDDYYASRGAAFGAL
jgi:sporulation protein YlmC with PRC-barrel domain